MGFQSWACPRGRGTQEMHPKRQEEDFKQRCEGPRLYRAAPGGGPGREQAGSPEEGHGGGKPDKGQTGQGRGGWGAPPGPDVKGQARPGPGPCEEQTLDGG